MTYNPNSPNGTQSPKDQVVQVMTNFSQFAAIFSSTVAGVVYNHTALNLQKQGDHESIIITNQTIDPTIENAVVLYAKNATSKAGTQPQLFYKTPQFLPDEINPDTPGNPPVQLTYNTVNIAGPVYQSFLPGGYLFYFGTRTGAGQITLSPQPTKILIAIAYPNELTTVGTPVPDDVSVQITSNFQFNIISSSAQLTDTFTWLAIATV